MRADGRAPRRRVHPPRRARAAPRRATSTTRSRSPTRRSWSCSTATTCPSASSSRRRSAASPTSASRSRRRRSTTPTGTAARCRRPRGASRRCSSARSPAARTATTRCSAAAPTSSSGAPRSSDVGGFPLDSVTEDFELSIALHERGWRSRYVPEVLAHGLGPEDMASYVEPAAALVARLPVGAAGRAALVAAAAPEDPVRAVGVVLPQRLDRARLHERSRSCGCSPAPSRWRPRRRTSSSATSRRTSGCRCSR